MAQPVLHTERLVLEPLRDEHLELEVELDADPEVLRYLWGRARDRDEVATSHLKRIALGREIAGLGYWMAFLRDETHDFAGLMMLSQAHGPDRPDDPAVAELGYRIPKHHWRKGYASEASRELLRHAFQSVGMARVIAQTMAVNEGSRAVMSKVGLRYVRTFHPHFDDPLPGTEQGEVEYAITREEWARPTVD
ncbi:GNAT family N-acetyltransferase [Flexivirga meconopsidis]|uniref:GNAT family N-acetyltransferase n=1 Tax=Flexivirga meconopsidis TaxID=2977121 RepID=UPI002240AA9E|nr:GNAT family N-acetyltransferase [Flexivirga meconopsidis]